MLDQLPALLAMVMLAVGDAQLPGGPPALPAAVETAPAAPDQSPIAIVWDAPDECPTVDALKFEIRRVAGPVPPPSEPLSAEVTVRRVAARGWQLTLATRAGARTGERRLAGSDCAELMRAAALVLGLMINPEAGAVAAPPPAAPPPARPAPPPPPGERRFAAGADIQLGSGALPGGLAPGLGLRFALAAGALSAELRGNLWTSRSTASPSDPAAGGTFNLVDFALAGCGRALRTRRVAPGLCAGAALVHLHGAGYGVTNPGDASAWWPAVFGEASLRVRVTTRNVVRLAGEALIPAGNPSFDLAGVGHVFQPASIWARGTIGWELHF